MKKTASLLLTVFSTGILLCLFAGGLSIIGYIIALIIGGELASDICSFVYTLYLPWVIKFTSFFAGIGLLAMYLSKKHTLQQKK